MTTAIIHLSIFVFALCAMLIILNQRIKKNVFNWCILIGVVFSATSMLLNHNFYSASFACFASFAAMCAICVTVKVFRKGEL